MTTPISMKMELDQVEGMFGPHDWEGTPSTIMVVIAQVNRLYIAGIAVYGDAEPGLDFRWERDYSVPGAGWPEVCRGFRQDIYEPLRPDLLVVEGPSHSGFRPRDMLKELFAEERDCGQAVLATSVIRRADDFEDVAPIIVGALTRDDVRRKGGELLVSGKAANCRLMRMMHDGRVRLSRDRSAYPQDILEQMASQELRAFELPTRGTVLKWCGVKGRRDLGWSHCVLALAGHTYLGLSETTTKTG